MADRRDMRDRTPEPGERPTVIGTTRARAAFFGLPMLYVLIAGTTLIVIAFLIIWFAMPPPRGASHATFLEQPPAGTLEAALTMRPVPRV